MRGSLEKRAALGHGKKVHSGLGAEYNHSIRIIEIFCIDAHLLLKGTSICREKRPIPGTRTESKDGMTA